MKIHAQGLQSRDLCQNFLSCISRLYNVIKYDIRALGSSLKLQVLVSHALQRLCQAACPLYRDSEDAEVLRC